LRILRFFRFHARFGEGEPDKAAMEACVRRANDLMALSRERIADELLKLLGLPEPAGTVGLVLGHGILKPVLPEIGASALPRLERLIADERAAGIAPEPLRRLAALLPAEPLLAERVAARLKLSNKARKQLACAVTPELFATPQALAYQVGSECAVDRLLLAGAPEQAAAIRSWPIPRLPLGGGALIARGLREGPEVARTLRAIEERWVADGFPQGERLEKIVAEEMDASRN
jgi:poly(A) polymerase